MFESNRCAIFVKLGLAIGICAGIIGLGLGLGLRQRNADKTSTEARSHQLLKKYPLIDGHNDWPWLIRENFRNNLTGLDLWNLLKYTVKNDTPSHTDITRLRLGQVAGQFWSMYTSCQHQGKDATVSFLEQIDLMNRILTGNPTVFKMARTAGEVREAFENGLIASLFGIEGGQAIDSSFAVLRLFFQLGVRYMTLTHNCNTAWADQHLVDRPNSTLVRYEGLTDFGKKIIKEMNRLGMVIDLSHVAKKTMLDVLNSTRSPVMFSHSSAYALCNHTRNVHDDILELVKRNRGIVMVAFTPGFISCSREFNGNITTVAAHINHIRKIAGIDSVGLGGDYDGVDRTPIGLEDVSKYPKLIEHLIEVDQWTDEEIIKLIGGNILRVLEENEKMAKRLANELPIAEELIPRNDLIRSNFSDCRFLDMYETESKNVELNF